MSWKPCIDKSRDQPWRCDGKWHTGWDGHDPYAVRCPRPKPASEEVAIPSEREEIARADLISFLNTAISAAKASPFWDAKERAAAEFLANEIRQNFGLPASEHLTRQALEQGSAEGSRATASRQPAGQASPEAPVSAGSSPSGDHQAQGSGA